MLKRICTLAAAVVALGLVVVAAQLSPEAQSVLPQGTRQVISINYRSLAANPVAEQLEKRVLPPGMQNLTALLLQGGVNPASDLNRLTFATFAGSKGVGLLGIAEGNFGGFQTGTFFHKSKAQPQPPQIDGVSVYSTGGMDFYLPDQATLVFGSREAISAAIATQQGAPQIGENEAMMNLIAGTQSSDIWSVLDASGAQTMVGGMIAGASSALPASLIAKRFRGARYTIAVQDPVQVNLELMTTDALSAAAVSTALNAEIAMRQKSETDPVVKALLGKIQVDSAGNDAFLQVSAPQTQIAGLVNSDLIGSILPK
ncbi:MAG: hypothetical protein ACRD1C_11685 [Terriglobales bacterium]